MVTEARLELALSGFGGRCLFHSATLSEIGAKGAARTRGLRGVVPTLCQLSYLGLVSPARFELAFARLGGACLVRSATATLRLAGPTGFEPVKSCVTGRRHRPLGDDPENWSG